MITIADVPIDIGRDEARRAAVVELSRPEYATPDMSLPARVLRWVFELLGELLERASAMSPAGYWGLLALAAVVVLAVIAVRLRLGRIGRVATRGSAPLGAGPASAAEHRRAADAHAERGEWALAIRERLRAVVRELEERDLLDAHAGRTAAEVAVEAGRVLPTCAEPLRAAAHLFDDVWYGGVPAQAWMDARMRDVDEAVRRARPVEHAGAPA
ncbi:DUF4129 domain-containing protein [Pseudonocardia acaciae]|uniref:DUF4129 domain-containing protein n=1 Tax=Pseudonocardia acaciae TaxID=551276 RepID=UPI00048F4E53|nr:DUF4129 domain-containing protein [Pseudonocardia acaciae]